MAVQRGSAVSGGGVGGAGPDSFKYETAKYEDALNPTPTPMATPLPEPKNRRERDIWRMATLLGEMKACAAAQQGGGTCRCGLHAAGMAPGTATQGGDLPGY